MPVQVTAIMIGAKDLARAKKFYGEGLGCTIDQDYPGLRFNLCHETGELRPFVNIFLNRENIRYLQGLDTPITAGATVHILQSVAGG